MTYAFFFGGEGWNQNSHFALTRALVERGTLYIDGYAVSTGDVSPGVGGHTYSNKAPGLSFLAAIPYGIAILAERALGRSADYLTATNQWIVSIATSGLCGALIAALLFGYARSREIDAARAVGITLLVAFGTIVFPYSTLFMAHVPAALFLLLAVLWWRDRPLLAGAAAGLSTACFYVSGVGALILVAMSWRRPWRFIAGGLPFAIGLAIYHTLCFGSPFRTSVEASTFTHDGLLFGVLRLPSIDGLWGLTFSTYRGLFVTSPILLLSVAGLWTMWRRREPLFAPLAGIAAAYILIIASFNFWHGGWAFGPRYILPIVPLLGVAMMFVAQRFRPLWVVLGALSIVFNFAATAVNPLPDQSLANPLRDELLPVLFTGRFPDRVLRERNWEQIGAGGRRVARSTNAGNLGEPLLGEGSRLSLVPVIVVMIGGAAILRRVLISSRPS